MSNTVGSGSNATSESFTFNDRGLVLTASGSAGATSYAYNGDGLTTSVTDAVGTTTYAYDSAGRLATLANPSTGTTAAYFYNADSQVSGITGTWWGRRCAELGVGRTAITRGRPLPAALV